MLAMFQDRDPGTEADRADAASEGKPDAAAVSSRIDVWYRLTERDAQVPSRADLEILSAEERTRAGRFLVDDHRHDFLAAHLLKRHALTAVAGRLPQEWDFVTTVSGKPVLVAAQRGAPPLMFNLSHARGLVACGVTQSGEIGVDVERLDRTVDGDAIARRYFAASEVIWLESLLPNERRRRFVELWSLKEACFKAAGSGLAGGLSTITFTFSDATGLLCSDPRWHLLLATIGTQNVPAEAGAHDGLPAVPQDAPARAGTYMQDVHIGLLAVACARSPEGGAHVVIHRPASSSVEAICWTSGVTFSVEA